MESARDYFGENPNTPGTVQHVQWDAERGRQYIDFVSKMLNFFTKDNLILGGTVATAAHTAYEIKNAKNQSKAHKVIDRKLISNKGMVRRQGNIVELYYPVIELEDFLTSFLEYCRENSKDLHKQKINCTINYTLNKGDDEDTLNEKLRAIGKLIDEKVPLTNFVMRLNVEDTSLEARLKEKGIEEIIVGIDGMNVYAVSNMEKDKVDLKPGFLQATVDFSLFPLLLHHEHDRFAAFDQVLSSRLAHVLPGDGIERSVVLLHRLDTTRIDDVR